jgi:hypothetical protein
VLNIEGSDGLDTVNVGLAGSTAFIKGSIHLTNQEGFTKLNVDDSNNKTTGRVITLDTEYYGNIGTIKGIGSNSNVVIDYWRGEVSEVTVRGGDASNVFNVLNTVGEDGALKTKTTLFTGEGADTVNIRKTTGKLTVNGEDGHDVVNLGDLTGSAQSIVGDVHVTNLHRFSTINVTDSNDGAARNVTFDGDGAGGTLGSITNLTQGKITYVPADVEGVTLMGGSGGNTFNVLSTRSIAQLILFAGSGKDKINVGSPFHTLDTIKSKVVVYGGGDLDTLIVDDSGSVNPHAYVQTGSTLGRAGGAVISFFGVETPILYMGATTGDAG